MAHQNPLPYSAATRQLNALVRKYNQATADSLGFELDLFVDKPEKPNVIEYTLVMKSQCDTAWEVRRISSSLFMNLQLDFMDKVKNMDKSFALAMASTKPFYTKYMEL